MAEEGEESMNISAQSTEPDNDLMLDSPTAGEDILDGSLAEPTEPQAPRCTEYTLDDPGKSDNSQDSIVNLPLVSQIVGDGGGDHGQVVMVSGPSHHVAMPTDQLGLDVSQAQQIRLVAPPVTNGADGLHAEQTHIVNGVEEEGVVLSAEGLAGIPISGQPMLVNMMPENAINHISTAPGAYQIADVSALQSILSSNGATQFQAANGETIQIITVQNPNDMMNTGVGSLPGGHKVWQLVPAQGNEMAQVVSAEVEQAQQTPASTDDQVCQAIQGTTQSMIVTTTGNMAESIASMLMPPPPPPEQNLPPGCPPWAGRLNDCEQIGDSYRGWVESEVQLDLLLTYHKQQTQSFWGTRQSPSPAKQSTRLMWKSQYVPFDGVPFVNSGSRAIVMECQYGPRRKGVQTAKGRTEQVSTAERILKGDFKQTCPARIYIKKVRKFPQFGVDINQDKKALKVAMDKAFHLLKDIGADHLGQERYYVQLPNENAHEFHVECAAAQEPPKEVLNTRLCPNVSQKIREMVSGGETRLYVIRKALRRFVEKELFESAEQVPEKHDLTFYPTVNDLQNHIHQAVKDIENGILPATAPTISVEGIHIDQPHAETVTVTLTQNPGEDGQHIISRVETHLSDGSTQISTTLTPETVRLLSKLHPNMFPAGSILQLQGGPAGAIQIANTTQLADPNLVSLQSNNFQQPADANISMNIQSVDSSVTSAVLPGQTGLASDAVPVILHSAGDMSQQEAFAIIENPVGGEEGQCSVYDDDGGLVNSSLMEGDMNGDPGEQILTVAMAPADDGSTVKVEDGFDEEQHFGGVDSS